MRNLILILLLSIGLEGFSQEYKNNISMCQFSSSFSSSSNINLRNFKANHFYNFKIENDKNIFNRENIKYLPTIIVFKNGKEVLRLESGINMKLPKDSEKRIRNKINSLL